MDTLDKFTRLAEALSAKKNADRKAAFKKIVNFLVSGTSWSAIEKELSSMNKNEISPERFGLGSDEIADLKKNVKAKDPNFLLSLFQKSMCKKIALVLKEVEKDTKVDLYEDMILPLLVMSTSLPLKYLPENDPFGARINYSVKDNFNKEKSFLYAPASYKSLSLSPSPSNSITRSFIIPILQFVIKSDRYMTKERLEHVPFIVQSLRLAVHFEDSQLELLRSSFWQLATKVIKAVDYSKTTESVAIFDQLNALTWHDNGEECTKAVWRSNGSSPVKNLVMSKEEMYAHIALLRAIGIKVTVNVHLKSCLRDVIKSIMKSIIYRKDPNDCSVLLKLLDSWIRKGKEGPLDVQLVRMMIRDVMDMYDSFLSKCPKESMGENTSYILTLGQDSLAINSNLKSIKSSLENIFERINNNITGYSLSDYIGFITRFINDREESMIDTKDVPWYILFRTVFIRCGVLKMKMEWVEKTEVLRPLLTKMTDLLSIISKRLVEDSTCDYLNECIPALTEVVYLLINNNVEKDKKWECIVSLCDTNILCHIIQSISVMKNQSAKSQCSSFMTKMMNPLTEIITTRSPPLTLSHFERFFTLALTVDLPSEIRESVCTLWRSWYGCRLEELSGVSITDELMGRLKWFDLPIPPNTINDKLEVKLEKTGASPQKSIFGAAALKSTRKGSLFSSPAPVKKTRNANDALEMIDLMDEDSVQFYHVEESPRKKQRMTEKQKEMMMEKKDRIPFMEDESRTGMAKIPSDIFELSISGVDGSSKGGSRKGQMKTDFSNLSGGKNESDAVMKESKKEEEETSGREEEEEKSGVKKDEEPNTNKSAGDSNIDEPESSCESMNEEMEEEKGDKEEKMGGRRKSKTPMKMVMKTREVRSPSRKKLEATSAMTMESPRRTNRKVMSIEEKKEGEDIMQMEVISVSNVSRDKEKNVSTPKRSEKITLSTDKKGRTEDGGFISDSSSSSVILLDDNTPSTQPRSEDSSPIKTMEDEGDLPVPRTPANHGMIEPVGILSSSKKNKSEKKKGGVHFNVSDEAKIDEEKEEEEVKEEEMIEKTVDETVKEDKNDKMVFPLLRDNNDSIDTIILRLGLNSRMVKQSLEKIGVKTVGQLASLSSKEINGIMGIKPPKMRTVETVLEGVLARSMKSGSKPLPPICTPEKKEEKGDGVSSVQLSPLSRISPSKPKSRKRLALSDSPIRTKKMKMEEEEKKESEEVEKKEEKQNETLIELDVIEDKHEMSEEVEKKEGKEEGMVVDEDKENKMNTENTEKREKQTPAIASVQDVISFISHLKEESIESLLSAHDQISRSFIEAIKEVTTSKCTN